MDATSLTNTTWSIPSIRPNHSAMCSRYGGNREHTESKPATPSKRSMRKILTVIAGISFGEAPRWHDGALYLSDMHADRVLRVNPAGTFEVVAQLQNPVSG